MEYSRAVVDICVHQNHLEGLLNYWLLGSTCLSSGATENTAHISSSPSLSLSEIEDGSQPHLECSLLPCISKRGDSGGIRGLVSDH